MERKELLLHVLCISFQINFPFLLFLWTNGIDGFAQFSIFSLILQTILVLSEVEKTVLKQMHKVLAGTSSERIDE